MLKVRTAEYHHLANEMLLGNLAANLLGNWATNLLFKPQIQVVPEALKPLIPNLDTWFVALALPSVLLITLLYERPFRRCLKLILQNESPDHEYLKLAQRRLLNEPYLVVILNLIIWVCGSLLFWINGSPGAPYIGLACGLITIVLAFFWVEHVTQHRLIHLFFPQGGLSAVPGAFGISLTARLIALMAAGALVPLCFVLLTVHWSGSWLLAGDAGLSGFITHLEKAVAIEIMVFLGLGLGLAVLVAQNLRKPLDEIVRTLNRIKEGEFTIRSKVYSNDEIGFTADCLNEMAQGLQEREHIKNTFGRYIDQRIRDEILNGEMPLDGTIHQASILFADLRDFTRLVDSTPPKTVVYMLNLYLAEMTAAVKEHNGLVFQFVGDEIEAVFGAPIQAAKHENQTVKAALAMRAKLDQLNRRLCREGLPALRQGIGINSGQVLAASIGSPERQTYTFIGNTVNLASRIQSLNKKFGTDILVSQEVSGNLGPEYCLQRMPQTVVQGRSEPLLVYALEPREPNSGLVWGSEPNSQPNPLSTPQRRKPV